MKHDLDQSITLRLQAELYGKQCYRPFIFFKNFRGKLKNITKKCTISTHTKRKELDVLIAIDISTARSIIVYKLYTRNSCQLIDNNASPLENSCEMHQCVYLHCTYSNPFLFKCAKRHCKIAL